MVKLTESIISGRTKSSNLQSVKKLNVWGCDIHDISIVAQMPNLEVLSLSVNNVGCLEPLAHCYNLKELYMRKNEVSDVNQLDYLSNLHKLKVLWLDDNPVADDPEYRVRVLRAVPQLQTFDNRSMHRCEKLGETPHAVNQEEVAFALSTSVSAQQQSSQLSSSQHSNSQLITGPMMSSQHNPAMISSQYNPAMMSSNPQMTSSMIGRSLDEMSFHEMQMQQPYHQYPIPTHNPGVQIIEGHSTPTHSVPMCEVAIYNPSLPPTSMTQSYHQGYTQGQVMSFGGMTENHSMDESWNEFADEESATVPPMPRFGLRKSPRSRMSRSRSVSPGRIREGRMDSILSAICTLMDELDLDSLKQVIDEAHERIKKQR